MRKLPKSGTHAKPSPRRTVLLLEYYSHFRCFIWVELPVQRRLYPIFVRNVGSPDIHECFRGLTGSQRTLGFAASHSPRCRSRSGVQSESTPLTASVSQVLHEVRNEQFLRWQTQMKLDPATRDNTKYCEFHRDYGHRTDNCIQLKREIEYLIQRGYLRRFISPGNQAWNQA